MRDIMVGEKPQIQILELIINHLNSSSLENLGDT